jgi:hypothetical protein
MAQLLLAHTSSCEPNHQGGIDGMSEMSGDDDVGAVLGFLYRVLRLEMHQLRRDDRSYHCQQPSKEFGGTRRSDRCGRLRRDVWGVKSWPRTQNECRESGCDIAHTHRAVYKDSRPYIIQSIRSGMTRPRVHHDLGLGCVVFRW